jgi:hypothetical protein
MLLFLLQDASTIVAVLVVLLFLLHSVQNTAANRSPYLSSRVVVMADTNGVFFSSLAARHACKRESFWHWRCYGAGHGFPGV